MKIYFDAFAGLPTVSVGTQAYIIAGMQLIENKFPGSEFILLSVCPEHEDHYLKDCGVNFTLIKREDSNVKIWKQVKKIIKGVDVVVSSWGDAYITCPPHQMLRKTLMLKNSKVPLILFTSSIGPFVGGMKTKMAKYALKMFDYITVRDITTLNYFNEIGIKNAKLVHDTAFALKPASSQRVTDILTEAGLNSGKYIGLNISVLMYNLFKRRGRDYAKEMGGYIDWLLSEFDLPVVLVPHEIHPPSINLNGFKFTQGGDDIFAIKEVMKCVSSKDRVHPMVADYSPMDTKGIIKGAEIFVGGRMHSIIAAVSTATPALIMKYSHKASGMMSFLKLDDYLWDTENDISELLEKTKLLWKNRASVKAKLGGDLPSILKEIEDLPNLIKL